ncbi:MAG: MMPL family transporter [Thermoleophilia bacterium]
MFTRLGGLTARYRWPIVVGWLVLAGAITLFAPNIDDVAVNDMRAFLAKEAPSLEAVTVVREAFPGRISPSSTVIVVDVGAGNDVRTGASWSFLQDVDTWLSGDAAPDVIERVVSPTSTDEQTARALVSEDGQVALLVVTFNSSGTETPTKDALVEIGRRLRTAPEGVSTYMTGEASIIGAYDEATRNSIDSTTWITILLVVVILLLVYRSPVSPFIPLLTIAIAYLISRGIVAFLGDGIMLVSGYTNIFLIVVLFGAGTDYCLFLISRFREEIVASPQTDLAVQETVLTVGETIASSAGTVVVGLSTMALAELGLFNTTGPSVAIGVVVALLAGLTFTPALLSLLGRRAFWPRRVREDDGSRFWTAWARTITNHPRVALVVTLAFLLPLALYGRGLTNDFDLLQDLPEDASARQGFDVLAEHLGPGTMQPLTVVVQGDTDYAASAGLTRVSELHTRLAALPGVSAVRSLTGSLEERGTLSVEAQLADQAAGVREATVQLQSAAAAAAVNSVFGGAGPALDPAIMSDAQKQLLELFSYLNQLGREVPRAAQDPAHAEALAALNSVAATAQSASTPDLQVFTAIVADLERAAAALEHLRDAFATEDALMLPDTYVATNEGLLSLRDAYLSGDERSARLQLVLDAGPYTPEAMAAVDEIRELLAAEGPGFVEGSSAIVADLRDGSRRDMVRAVVFVLLGVFLVLVLLLRALVAPLYLILTILISYGATLGIVRLVFGGILGVTGVTWWVPIFMFVMLVALGMDYNIFLMGRVKEEVARNTDRTGIRIAVSRTGGIITSAGIIMAGTFAAMMSARILGLVQVGFAVAVGVLLDTFVVRTALVPAIALILGRWSWWPRRAQARPQADRHTSPQTSPQTSPPETTLSD